MDHRPWQCAAGRCCPFEPAAAARVNARFDRWLAGSDSPQYYGNVYHSPVYGTVPVSAACKLAPFGKTNTYEAKMLCAPSSTDASCVVISIGSDAKWEFEKSIVERTSCRVEVFDCTLRGHRSPVPHALASRVKFHHVCLGSPQYYSDAKGCRMCHHERGNEQRASWAALLRLARLPAGTAPTVLKIDCEGCEQELFRELLRSDATGLLPDQIAVELHYPLRMRPNGSWATAAESAAEGSGSSKWLRRFAHLGQWPVDAMLGELYRRAGFTVASHVRPRASDTGGGCCVEVLLARTGRLQCGQQSSASTRA